MVHSELSDESFPEHSGDETSLKSSSNIAAVLEKVDLLWKPPSIPEHAKKGDYKKAIKDSNNQISKLTAAIKELILEDSRLRKKLESQRDGSTVEASVPEAQRRDHQYPEEFRKFCNSIRLEAKRFGFLYEMYLESSSIPFEYIPETERIEPTTLARYLDGKIQKAAIAAELYESMPSVLHSTMSTYPDDFSNLFIKSLNENRKILVSKARAQCYRIFPELEAISRTDRLNHKDTRAAIYGPNDKRVKFAPVLFPHRDTTKLQTIFMAPQLPRLMRVLILAPSSLDQDKKAPSRQTFGELWRVNEVSAGSIAFVAVLAIHLFSGDKQFREIGSDSGIPYRTLFNSYKQILLGRMANERFTVFNWYNERVFKGRPQEHLGDAEHFSGLDEAIDADCSDMESDTNEQPGACLTSTAIDHNQQADVNLNPTSVREEAPYHDIPTIITAQARGDVVNHGHLGDSLSSEVVDEQEPAQASRSKRGGARKAATRRSTRRK